MDVNTNDPIVFFSPRYRFEYQAGAAYQDGIQVCSRAAWRGGPPGGVEDGVSAQPRDMRDRVPTPAHRRKAGKTVVDLRRAAAAS